MVSLKNLKKDEIVWMANHLCLHSHSFLAHPNCYKERSKTKTLFIDIELSPASGWIWGKYRQDVIEFNKDWHILCFGYKWLNGKTKVLSGNEKKLIKTIRDLLNEADLVVAHNGDRFDIRKINTRIAFYGFDPPSPYKTYDTLKKIKKYFGLLSNKLGDIGNYFNLGTKIETGGFKLWKECMAGDKKAWKLMKKYNKQDVELLEKIYKKLEPWN